MSILESIQALTTEQAAAARETYSALIREQHPTPAQAEAFAAAMELLNKTPDDVRADEAIIAQVQQIKAMLPTPRMVAAKRAAADRADAHAAEVFPQIAADMAKCGPPFVIEAWLHRAMATLTATGPQRAEFTARINAAARGIGKGPDDTQTQNFFYQQEIERETIINAHPDLFPGGQFDPRWSLERPAPADAQAQGDPAPEASADVEAVEQAGNSLSDTAANKLFVEPSPAQADDTLPFTEPAAE